jgi:putative ABC transport system permease protein
VLPAGFALLNPAVDIWMPLGFNPHDELTAGARVLFVIGRLRPGVTIEQARGELETIGGRLERARPVLNTGWRPSLFPLHSELVGSTRQALQVFSGAVGCLLLMACANVANLLLARGASRRKEMAVRGALGAVRARVIRQLLTEHLLLATAGGAGGLLLGWAGVTLVTRLGPSSIPRLADAHLDGRLFLFVFLVSAVTGLLFGLAPAVRASGSNLNTPLVEGGRGGTAGRSGRRLRDGLVVAEVALAVVVLIGAGLLMRSFLSLRTADPGFRADGLLTFRIPLQGSRYAAPERRIALFAQMAERISSLPGVRSVGAVNSLPLTGLGVGATFAVEGRPAPAPELRPMALLRTVTPDYFRTMKIPLLAGRELHAGDMSQSGPVVVVNRTLARRFWPDGNPIGGRLIIDLANKVTPEIVGVVGDVRPDRLEGEEWPTIYNPYPQAPAPAMEMVVRTTGPPLSLASAAQHEVHRLDPDQPVARVRTMDAVVDEAIAGARFHAVLLTVFAEIAFLLAAVGIYGVMAYDVSERTREIGIRMAMGAQGRDVLQLVLGHAARLAACGIALGLAIAFALTRLMATMLYGVKATDAYTFAGISLLLGAVALASSYLPSRRAMQVDAVTALRHE